MYKIASDRRQNALHRGRPTDWVNGEERLSAEDKLKQMQAGVLIIEARLMQASGQERKDLGLQKLKAQTEITEFRKQMGIERRKKDGLSQVFMDVAKEMLGKLQFDLIYRASVREHERRQAEIQNS